MKRIFAFALVLALALSLAACGAKKDEEVAASVFKATIAEIGEGSMLVTPAEGSWESSAADAFLVPLRDMPPSSEPQVGDLVEITYDGYIQETWPARIEGVRSIVILDE